MANVKKIVIKQGFSDGTLELSDHGHTLANKKDFVNWSVKKHTHVTSIDNILIKSGGDIFLTLPHQNGDEWNAEIKDSAPYDSVCEYGIAWNGTYGPKVYDPKISVRPVSEDSKGWLIVILGVLGLLSVGFFSRKRSRK